jgi:serine/threonine protein kinase
MNYEQSYFSVNLGGHENILAVLGHGYLNNSSYYFFDMELCQLNLSHYILSEWNPTLLDKHLTITGDNKIMNAMSIMRQITNGVIYIHSQHEVHRDLKPLNSTLL